MIILFVWFTTYFMNTMRIQNYGASFPCIKMFHWRKILLCFLYQNGQNLKIGWFQLVCSLVTKNQTVQGLLPTTTIAVNSCGYRTFTGSIEIRHKALDKTRFMFKDYMWTRSETYKMRTLAGSPVIINIYRTMIFTRKNESVVSENIASFDSNISADPSNTSPMKSLPMFISLLYT